MLFEPGVEVNEVVDNAAPQAKPGRSDPGEEGGADAKIFSRLLAG